MFVLLLSVPLWQLSFTHREDGGGGAQQQQSMVVSLRHVGRSDALNHQLHTELILVQDVCTETLVQSGWRIRKWRLRVFSASSLTEPPSLCRPTCTHGSSVRGQFVADVEQTAEQQLFGVLHVAVITWTRLQTPEDTTATNISLRF